MGGKRFGIIQAVLLFWCFSLPVSAADDLNHQIGQVLESSGLTKQIREFPRVVDTAMTKALQQEGRASASQRQQVTVAIKRAINVDNMIGSMVAILAQKLTLDDVAELSRWYNSDIGRQVTRAEDSATTPDAYRNMYSQAQTLLGNRELVAYAKELDQLLGATDYALSVQESVQLAVYTAVVAHSHGPQQLDLNGYRQRIQLQSAEVRDNLEGLVILSLVYIYQGITPDVLAKYKRFLQTPAARKFNREAMSAMGSVTQTTVTAFAEQLLLQPHTQGHSYRDDTEASMCMPPAAEQASVSGG